MLVRRLALLGSRWTSSRSRPNKPTMRTIHVRPSSSSLGVPHTPSGSSDGAGAIEDDQRTPGWRGGRRVASVVPVE
ncbi:unnamed protein product [Ectocarpus sp. 8 AP-2014]